MIIKPQFAITITLALFISGIILTSAAGLWTTESTKIPAQLTDTAYAGAYDPADIRGSYTFSEISTLYNIPLADLAAAFGVDTAQAPDFQCKELEGLYGTEEYEIGTASVRAFTAFYLGYPYDLTAETYLPDAAARLLEEKGGMTPEQREYLAAHTVPAA